MKLGDGFDARRLRPRAAADWRWRGAWLLAALLNLGGLALAGAGVAALFSATASLADLRGSTAGTVGILLLGLLLFATGCLLRRRSSRRRHGGALSLAPHLMRKHN